MATNDIGQTTTTTTTAIDFSVGSRLPDSESAAGWTSWNFPDAAKQLGYATEIPELRSAVKALVTYICGQGLDVDSRVQLILDNLTGIGNEGFPEICMNLITQKKIFGDAFAEIIRNDQGTLINLKPLFPGDMTVVVNEQGIIQRYEQRNKKSRKNFSPDKIFHLSNDRIANEIHGQSVILALKFIIDAKNEALQDERTIKHRELMGVLEVDSNDPSKIVEAVNTYVKAVKEKEILVTIKGTSEIKDNPMTHKERLQWLQYLDNLFYQVLNIPKVVATSEGYSEAGAKVGIFTFDPVYTSEQRLLSDALWNQVAIRVTFNPAPSLGGTLQESEAKNTGQTGFQPNDLQVSATRTE